ncbi:nucleotidyltransferase-like protein [Bacillaceae bacterium W0354]
MQNILRPIYQERASQRNTLGILIYEKLHTNSPSTDDFDVILLIVVKDAEEDWFVKHYEFEEKTAAMHIVDEQLLNYWIETSGYRKVIDWLINGRIVFDRNEYLDQLKNKLEEFPEQTRRLRKTIEYAKLIRCYRECKALYEAKHYMDANSMMVRSLHYLARVAVLEKGFYPEITVWNQVKKIDPEIYKLYVELIESEEPIDKRIKLMLIASEFTIQDRAYRGAEHLLTIMKEKEEPWTFGELKVHPEVQHYTLDLSILLEYLVERGIVEASLKETKGKDIYHRQYLVKTGR